MFKILDININIGHDSLIDILNDCIYNFSDYNYDIFESKLSRSNKDMYKLEVSDNGTVVFTIVAEKGINDEFIFKKIKLNNFNNSFYIFHSSDERIKNFVDEMLMKLSRKSKGDVIYYHNSPVVIVKGRNSTNASLAIIDNRTKKIYSENKDVETLDEDDDSVQSSYIPTYLLNDWLEENQPFKNKLQSVNPNDKFDLMAQYAIFQKNKNVIDPFQFRDLFIQIGTFAEMIGGFKDETVKTLYSFFI